MIVLPGQTARSVPFDFALDKPYRVKVSVTGDNIQVAIPEGADLAWENAPLKANPTEYPMTFTSRLAVEITGFKVTQLGTLPPKPPADGQPPADQTRPVPNEKK
jgi:hypothetical protein